jgi:hypothetical protein
LPVKKKVFKEMDINISEALNESMKSFLIAVIRLPHSLFGLLERLREEIDILECGDQTLLSTRPHRLKRDFLGPVCQSMLWKNLKTYFTHLALVKTLLNNLQR